MSKKVQFPKLSRKRIAVSVATLAALLLIWLSLVQQKAPPKDLDRTAPLVMTGGDPYIRTLMRTISASEAQDGNPYTVLYGGQHITDLSRHPNQCITVVSGLHKGECTTAAGRYQVLSTTWNEKVQQYHPEHTQQSSEVASQNFEPKQQDAVIYAWLSDRNAWGIDVSTELEKENLNEVLKHLSPTWTSLGYGIETNSVTSQLPKIYQKALAEELALAKLPASVKTNRSGL